MKKFVFISLALIILFPAFCQAKVNLLGTIDPEKIAIADKYSQFYRNDINIQIVDLFPGDPFKLGSTRLYNNGYKDVRMKDWGYDNFYGGYTFEFTMNHELCHYYFWDYTEEQCDDFADRMINFVNNLNI